MDSFIHVGDHRFQVNLNSPHDISIPIDFEGEQLNYFNVPNAIATPYEKGMIKGSTHLGGGCNFDSVSFIPHCHMTHTECVGHIVDESVFVNQLPLNGIKTAQIISITPESEFDEIEKNSEFYKSTDKIITKSMIKSASEEIDLPVEVLVVRTLPNPKTKLTMKYDEKNIPPYFSLPALEVIKSSNINHLCIDLPSLDRAVDGGLLAAHHLFWDIPLHSHSLNGQSVSSSTVTELVYITDEVKDGFYFINLQVANLSLDASLSRPVLYSVLP